ncbi:MAG: hypothetical protein GX799_05260 [Crenarchaeota archaeon]|jgi:nitrous oxidase accessory protein NosD|nr:hypothetical protein [Thermoproteota archaeon]
MSKHIPLVLVPFLLMASMAFFVPVNAENRTLVVPDQYASIQDAINSADDGDTIFFKIGIYEAPLNQTLVINKAISLIGEDPEKTIINLHPPLVPMSVFTYSFMGYLDALNIRANNVNLSCLTIRSDRASTLLGNGGAISVSGDNTRITDNIVSTSIVGNGNEAQIVKNMVKSISLRGLNQVILQNTLNGGISEGEFILSCIGTNNTIIANELSGENGGCSIEGSNNYIIANSITNMSSKGILMAGDKNIIAKNSVVNGSISINGSSNLFFGNQVNGNLAVVGNYNIFDANYLQGLVLGNRVNDAATNTFYHNYFDFVPNDALPLSEKTFTVWAGVKGPNYLDNGKEGNYWSDYKGDDYTFDGIGDTPYVIDSTDPLNYENIASFDIANVTLIDHYPLITPFDINSVKVDLPEWITDSSILDELPVFNLPQPPAPFSTVWIIIIAASVSVAVAGAFVYLVKTKKSTINKSRL